MIQRSDEWFSIRLGKITSSRIAHLMAGKTTAEYQNCITEIVLERMTGTYTESYVSPAMQWGIDHEDDARAEYEAVTGNIVLEEGFIIHPDYESFGCSPDGLILVDGMEEIKCPNSTTHIHTIITGTIDKKYLYQMNWQMFCALRKWCDFTSYDPRMPEGLRIFIKRVDRNEVMIAEMKQRALEALELVESKIKALEALRK